MDSMSDIPDSNQIAADERRIGELLRAVEAPAPSGLQARIAARNERRPWWQGAPAFALGLAGAATAACAALVIVLTSSVSVAAPTVADASRPALARPTHQAPAGLVATGTNIAFPNKSARGWHWPSTGTRSDQLGGRAVTTVFYRYEGNKVGYAIVAGAPLRWGANGIPTSTGGRRYAVILTDGARIVTWVQDGHTCIIASRTAAPQDLLALAGAEQHTTTA
jgi:hypothetical protein